MKQPNPNIDAPLHPAGEGIDAIFLPVGQINKGEHFVDTFAQIFAAHAIHLAKEGQILACT